MSRLAGLSASLLLPLCVALAPTVASAQQPGQGPPMPIALDLAKVPVGSWADYNMSVGQLAKMKMRMALVGKAPAGTIIETTVDGEMMAQLGGKMVMQVTHGARRGEGRDGEEAGHADRRRRSDGDAHRDDGRQAVHQAQPEDVAQERDHHGRGGHVQDQALSRQVGEGREGRLLDQRRRAAARPGEDRGGAEGQPADQGPGHAGARGQGGRREGADHQAGEAVRPGGVHAADDRR